MRIATRTLVCLGLVVGGGFLLPAPAARAGGDWNDQGVKWVPYTDGLATAKKEKKPVCLVFYTEWCPHCQNYSRVFHDPKVIEQTKRFVMVHVHQDKKKELSNTYEPDGEYIPRTNYLKSHDPPDTARCSPATGPSSSSTWRARTAACASTASTERSWRGRPTRSASSCSRCRPRRRPTRRASRRCSAGSARAASPASSSATSTWPTCRPGSRRGRRAPASHTSSRSGAGRRPRWWRRFSRRGFCPSGGACWRSGPTGA